MLLQIFFSIYANKAELENACQAVPGQEFQLLAVGLIAIATGCKWARPLALANVVYFWLESWYNSLISQQIQLNVFFKMTLLGD